VLILLQGTDFLETDIEVNHC